MESFNDEFFDEDVSLDGINCKNMYQFTLGDEMSTTLSKASNGTDKSASSGHASRCSSEIAGERLYQNALETRKKIQEKIQEKIKKQSRVQKRTLNLATRGRHSRESSASHGTPPRYIQLYEYSKIKKNREDMEANANGATDVIDSSPSRNLGCERLYNLSTPKQQEGRERRAEIMRANERPPLPGSHYKKISIADGTKIYDRGMKRKIDLELKRMEAAFEMEELYVSPLIPNSVVEEFYLSVPGS